MTSIGFDWAQLAQAFGIATGKSLDPMRLIHPDAPNAAEVPITYAQNPYFAQRHAAGNPLATAAQARLEAANQRRAALRAQQAANFAAIAALTRAQDTGIVGADDWQSVARATALEALSKVAEQPHKLPTSKPSPKPSVWPWVAGGVGVLGLVVGVLFFARGRRS